MLALRLDPSIEERLKRLVKKTGRSKIAHLREAILDYLQDMEEGYLAMGRLKRIQQGGRTYSAQEAKRALGL